MHAKIDLSFVGEKSKLQDDLVCYLIVKVFIGLYKIQRKKARRPNSYWERMQGVTVISE